MPDRKQVITLRSKEFVGSFAILLSMWCFYLEAAVVRWATTNRKVALGSEFSCLPDLFMDFGHVGCLSISTTVPRPRKYRTIVYRDVTNLLAVFCS
jgi:hypothetical protein